jgi:excisionase family DNA binding protein
MLTSFAKQARIIMPELSSLDAARVIGISDETIRSHVTSGVLSARRVGRRGIVRIDVDDLRAHAEKYQYRFDDELAAKLAK